MEVMDLVKVAVSEVAVEEGVEWVVVNVAVSEVVESRAEKMVEAENWEKGDLVKVVG